MPIFVVVTDELSTDVSQRLEKYPSVQIGPTAYLIHSEKLTVDIATDLRIRDGKADIFGIVLGLDEAYSGFHRPEVWEWLRRYSTT